ncbi:Sulfatase [Hexamita inflata]|uniref:Sulfatase n=1 Tax=Hexamita inflata TaxID=28002 RepID=A0AA86U717_9EUKA|nr:Sulfatase [Hexamita inflata]
MKLQQTEYFPLGVLICVYMFTLLKFFDQSTSKSQIVSNQLLVIPTILIYTLDILAITIVGTYLSARCKKIFSIPIQIACMLYFTLICLICAFDEENSNEMQLFANQYYFIVYYLRQKSYYDDTLSINGENPNKSISGKVLANMLARSLTHWVIIFAGCFVIGAFFAICITLQIIEIKKIKKMKKGNQSNEKYILLQNTHVKKSKIMENAYFQMIVVLLNLVTFIIMLSNDTNLSRMISPPHWNFYKSHFKPRFSKDYAAAVQQYRGHNPLDDGYDWIDQRVVPEYPTVYAPKEMVCSYNPSLNYCQNLPIHQRKAESDEKRPDVVVIIIESFTPGPTMLDNNVVESQDSIVDGPLYKALYLPNLRKISQSGVSFSALSSNGLPTVYGWHSLLTGEIPYSNSMNMVQSIYNDVDDFPSYFNQQNYHTLYISPSKFKFDGKHNWVFRGRELVQRDPSNLKQMPLWFNQIFNYFPTQSQAEELNVEQFNYKTWVPDRITAAQFIKHFKEAKKQEKPVLGVWATVDTHMPFSGQDDLKYYEEFKFGKGVDSLQNDKFDRYATCAKYADHYIGQVTEYLQQNYNNTILVVLGDHGAREILLGNEQVDKNDINSTFYDDSCNHKPFSNDQLFTTTGTINYLGDNTKYQELFKDLTNKVIKTPVDHQDMIRTIYDLIGNQTASSRNGRNLIEVGRNISANQQLRQHWSLRSTMLHSELATEREVFRFHSLGAEGEVFNGIYPTCVTGEVRKDISKSQYGQFRQYQKLIDYLQRNNKQFSYKFRNSTCLYPQLCAFPVNKKALNKNAPLLYVFVLIFVGLGIGTVIEVVKYVCSKIKQQIKKHKEEKNKHSIQRAQLINE